MTNLSENTAPMQTSFQGLNDLQCLKITITRHKFCVEKSDDFWYNARHKVLVLSSLLALRQHLECYNARSLRPVKELPLHIVKTLCIVLVSLPHAARKMRWRLLNLPMTCLSSKKLQMRKLKGKPMLRCSYD